MKHLQIDILKEKVKHELNLLNEKEKGIQKELDIPSLEMIKELAKTYYYLCKIDKYGRDHKHDEENEEMIVKSEIF